MALGIRPINDFVFKKIFGSAHDRRPLVHLLNAILRLKSPIIDVILLNPYSVQDFQDDKLSILDLKATDVDGASYHIEVQLAVREDLVRRIVFYGCELVADQLHSGENYNEIRTVYSICILNDILWPDAKKVHHCFRLTDAESGRVLGELLEIHTVELERYNLQEGDLATADELDCWLYWFRHAQDYEAEQLRRLFPQPGLREATDTLIQIAEITEDKAMYDAREKALRDERWKHQAAIREGEAIGEARGEARGKAEGEVKLIRTLQELLLLPVSEEPSLRGMKLEDLVVLADSLREQLRARQPK